MRFLITGGCGFIGSAVVRLLVERGARVLNVDRRRRTPHEPQLAAAQGREGYARLEADAADRTMMRAIFREFKPEHVIHLAGSSGETGEALFDAEVGAAFSILEASRGYLDRLEAPARDAFRIVHALHAEPEETFAEPTLHDTLRASNAQLMTSWAKAHDLPLVSCVSDHVFGPWQTDSAFPAALGASMLDEKPFALPAAGETSRDWLPVRDFADGLIRAALSGAPLTRHEFSVGAERRDLDIAESIAALLDARRPRARGSYADLILRAGSADPGAAAPQLDSASAENTLGWAPQGFHAGLERLASWLLASRAAAPAPVQLAAE